MKKSPLKILLVEPQKNRYYHTPYPPLGLLKIASLYKKKGHIVKLTHGISDDGYNPDRIYITSLFTYSYKPVHESIRYYTDKYKKSEVTVGGIYATLCKDHLKNIFKNRINIFEGLYDEAEGLLPDYSLIPKWKTSIIFSSRGCIRKCAYCSVPKLESKFSAKKSIKHLIYPGHNSIILWDNNILASPYLKNILNEIEDTQLKIDFNQGLDARLLTEKIALKLKRLKLPIIRLAYDTKDIKPHLKKSIDLLKDTGFRGKNIIVYCLHNYLDSPYDFLNRIKDLMEWSVVAYPMRYEPLEPRQKNTYISPNWTALELEMIARARRVIGYGGSFPPYIGLRKKILKAKNFKQAFELRPTASK